MECVRSDDFERLLVFYIYYDVKSCSYTKPYTYTRIYETDKHSRNTSFSFSLSYYAPIQKERISIMIYIQTEQSYFQIFEYFNF